MRLYKKENGFELIMPELWDIPIAVYPWDITKTGLIYTNCVELFEEENTDYVEVLISARIYDNFKFCYKLEKKF